MGSKAVEEEHEPLRFSARTGYSLPLSILLSLLIAASIALIALFGTARADSLFVTDPGNSGPGTLRAAIEEANGNGEPDTITFASDMTILPLTSYQITEDYTTIDAEDHLVVIDGQHIPGGVGPYSCLIFLSDGNVIDGLTVVGAPSSHAGVLFAESNGNIVRGCMLGTRDGDSSDPNGFGVQIIGDDNLIGGDEPGDHNIVSGNNPYGVFIIGSGNVVEGNYIGVGVDGDTALENQLFGVFIISPSGISTGNIISNNVISVEGGYNVHIVDCEATVITGNHIGVNAAGDAPAAGSPSLGISIADSSNTTIGGSDPLQRNIISGNNVGVYIYEDDTEVTGNVIAGNYIGTDSEGELAIPNSFGVQLSADNNRVGGDSPAERNVISGNTNGGVIIVGEPDNAATGNVVSGNFIGTEKDGKAAIPNDAAGVLLWPNTIANVIGGDTPGERNVISGNGDGSPDAAGIIIEGTECIQNVVSGNYIGTDSTGANPLPNQQCGVILADASGNLIGGDIPLEGNVISGNTGSGVRVDGNSGSITMNNIITANHIGCSTQGDPIPNGSGITLGAYAQNNQVGGAGAQEGNAVSHNTSEGIMISGDENYQNAIIGNSFEGNGGLAIDIVPDAGPNAPPDSFPYPAAGQPNHWMSLPEIGSALDFEGGTEVRGTCVPDSLVRLYRAEEDSTGYGEGAEYLGWAQGNGAGEFSREGLPLAPGEAVTALATDSSGNSSEFSKCVTVLDRTPPEGSLAINNGAPQTARSEVKLYLDAYDKATPKARMKMMISNKKSFPGASWEAFTEKKDWELVPGLGKRTVYVKYRDEAGNVSPTYSDKIEVVEEEEEPDISPVWYFAEGCTRDPFEEWIIIMNPYGEDAYIDVAFYTPQGNFEKQATVEPYRRYRMFLDGIEEIDGKDVAARIVARNKYGSPTGVICERSMYWRGPAGEVSPNRDEYHYDLQLGACWWERSDGHNSTGATSTSREWYFGEGCTAFGFDTWLLILNPNGRTATVTLQCITDSGRMTIGPLEIPANSRASVGIDEHLPSANVSVKVESDIGVVAERSMYWDEMRGGHSNMGVMAPSCEWLLPEGSTAWGFDEWVLVQNPNGESAELEVRLCGEDGIVGEIEISVGPYRRKTIHLNELAPNMDVAAEVLSTNGVPVICERSMYWGDKGHRAGHNSPGAPAAAREWYLAEGEDLTCLDLESYLLILNPTDETLSVEFFFYGPSGLICWDVVSNIRPHSRRTVRARDYTDDSVFCVEAKVAGSGGEKKVVLERTTYWCGKYGGHVTVGYAPPIKSSDTTDGLNK